MRQPIDQRFRTAFEHWAPPAPPRKRSFDDRVRASFASFKVRPTRSWNGVQPSPRQANPAWPPRIFAFAAVLILAMLSGLAVSDAPHQLSQSSVVLDFIPEGPKIEGPTPKMGTNAPALVLNSTQPNNSSPGSASRQPVLNTETALGLSANQGLSEQIWPLEWVLERPEPLQLQGQAAGIHPSIERPSPKRASRPIGLGLDVRAGISWGLQSTSHSLPQQVSLGKASAPETPAQTTWIQLGLRRRIGQHWNLNAGLNLNLQQHTFSRSALHHAPLNSIASGLVHSNIISPLGPVSGLAMNIDYFAPESEAQVLNSDTLLGGPMQRVDVQHSEISLALGLSFRPQKNRGLKFNAWSWQAEAFVYPGLLIYNRATVQSDQAQAVVGEIQGMNPFTLSGSLSLSMVHTRPSGLSFYAGPTFSARLNQSNTLQGSSGIPISLGAQFGMSF